MLSTRSNIDSLLPAFGSMRREVQRALDDVGHGQRLACPLSVWQDDESYHIHADIPGLQDSDIDLQFEDGKLWIRGERQWFGGPFSINERGFGRFERAVMLPDTVDPASIEATLEGGVLMISVSKKPEALPRTIEIRTGQTPTKALTDDSAEQQ